MRSSGAFANRSSEITAPHTIEAPAKTSQLVFNFMSHLAVVRVEGGKAASLGLAD